MNPTHSLKPEYTSPVVVEFGSVVALTGACDGKCIDGVGGQSPIE